MPKDKRLFLGIVLLVISVGLLSYPIIATRYAAATQSLVCADYTKQLDTTDKAAITAALSLAREYNNTITAGAKSSAFDPSALRKAQDSYMDLLNISGDGIMGWLEIPKINVKLPIYHGTSDATLTRGIGHLMGSSLPVGGPSTHTVLTAHSGMASNIMFSNLPALERGDSFFVHVLGETLSYQVDQILTVLPTETKPLEIQPDEDHCTLITCTPFGVNTHRLLVRGVRASTPAPSEPTATIQLTADTWQSSYIDAVLVGALIAIVILLLYSLHQKKNRRD